ncbi:MAG: cell division protein ZapB [Desulfobacca sp.]|uniref:cell division protein ZapB n=1 Tax=Desulfobacca sp. TaxID=2067990 RepID=UPI004049980D
MALELFEVLERKLENLLGQYQTLQSENATLMKMLEEQEKALAETREALTKLNKERDLVRQRLDQLLHKLEVLGSEK